ncbi:hypothetical protein ABWH92_11075 [Ahrensia marina]|jgi:hypothetical protein|uniref:hypothetical protein n=1 Tax=Ahrensia marina TaxID=1514904 RepID=UPI0035D070CF
MAVFAFSEPQRVFADQGEKPSIFRRALNAIIEARMAQAQRQVKAHIATLDPKTRAKFDLGDAVTGKNGVYIWPY